MPIIIPLPPPTPSTLPPLPLPGDASALEAGSFGSLSWGPGTRWEVTKLEGPWDFPTLTTDDTPNAGADGTSLGTDYLAAKTITLSLRGWPGKGVTYRDLLDQLHENLPRMKTGTGVLQLTGLGKMFLVRPRSAPPTVTSRYLVTVDIQFLSGDGLEYGIDEKTAVLHLLDVSGGGFDAPFDAPLAIVAPSGGTNEVICTNDGDETAYPVALIVGPCANPVLSCPDVGGRVLLPFTVQEGESALIDFGGPVPSVTMSTGAPRVVDATSTWWGLPPKSSHAVVFTADDYNPNASCTLTYRDTSS